MLKVIVITPKDSTDQLIEAMSNSGAGIIGNYSHCAFIIEGTGNWKSEQGSNPIIGKVGKISREIENKIEMVCPENKVKEVITAIKKCHPYETPAIEIYQLLDIK